MSKYAGKLITFGVTAGYSMQLPGVATAYLETPWNAALTFGTGDWTIEAWIYPTDISTQVAIISNWTATAGQFQLRRTTANRLEIVYNLNGTTTTLTGTIGFITPDKWTHVCARRSGANLSICIDGVQSATANVGSTTISGTGQVIRVGVQAAAVNPFRGFISNARIVIGTSIYSGTTFNVPMQLDPAESGTQYLVCAAPTFKDLSANNLTVAGLGTYPVAPQVSTFTPYGGQSPLTSNPALGAEPSGIYSSSDLATYSVSRAIVPYDPYGKYVRTLIHGSGWRQTENNDIAALQNYSYTAATSTASTIGGGNTLTIGGTVTGTFTVGMPITGTGVREGTAIVGYGTGTGGAGTYYVSGEDQTVASTAIDGVDSGYYVTKTATSGHTIHVTQGSFSPFSLANWGYLNDNATASYVDTGASANLSFGTGDYTIEFWVMFPVVTASKYILDMRSGGANVAPSIITNASSQIELNGIFNSAFIPVRYRWYHVALCRSGGTARFYIDGVQTASVANSTNYTFATPFARFAAAGDATTPTNWTNITFSNVRIIKGQALYTGGFTPSQYALTNNTVGATGAGAATKLTGTVALLTFQDGRFKDNSGNALSVTPKGNTTAAAARIITYAPIYTNRPYSPGSAGGSIYFSGDSSYLTMAGANTNCAFGTDDFTIECWIYPTSIAAVQLFFDTMGGTTTGRLTLQYETNESVSVTYGAGSNFLTSTADTAPISAWTHIYVTRISGTSYLYINGVQQSTTTTNPSFICDANRPILGSNGSGPPANVFKGYISGLRILRTGALLTSVPTEPPQMIQYTALLMNGANGGIYDTSGNNSYISAGSTYIPSGTSNNPVNGGAILFNGTTDYLQATDPAILTVIGDWTVEAWVYVNAFGAVSQAAFQVNGNNNSYAACRLDITTTGTLQLLVSTSGALWAINATSTLTISTATWTHLAVVRSGGSIYAFANGRLYTSGAINALTATMTPSISRFGALSVASPTFNSNFLNGRMSDIRVTQWARYSTTGFTPPTSMFQDM